MRCLSVLRILSLTLVLLGVRDLAARDATPRVQEYLQVPRYIKSSVKAEDRQMTPPFWTRPFDDLRA